MQSSVCSWKPIRDWTGSIHSIELPRSPSFEIEIYRGLEKWELMQEVAKRVAHFQPGDVRWTVSLAHATPRSESIETAKEVLLNAEPKFPKEAAIKYKLACYFCQTGAIQNAKNYLKKAFELDPNCRITALEDEDLKPLWESL